MHVFPLIQWKTQVKYLLNQYNGIHAFNNGTFKHLKRVKSRKVRKTFKTEVAAGLLVGTVCVPCI